MKTFKASFPVLCGYIPVGMAFGFLFCQLGFPWYFASLMSFLTEAASAQFMALPLLENHYSLTKLTLVVLIINSRHLFYGLSLLKRYHTSWWKRLYLIWGLTDETYSIVTSHPEEDVSFCLKLTALNHLYWVIGTTLGALIGSAVQFQIPGIEFMLTALFVVLAIEQAMRVKAAAPFIIALIWAVLAAKYVPGQMLIVAIALSAFSLVILQKVRRTA